MPLSISTNKTSRAMRWLYTYEVEFTHTIITPISPMSPLRAIGCKRGEASSSTGSKGKWSPEKAKDLFYLLNKKIIKREKEEEKKQEEREKRGEDLRGDKGVT